MLGRLLRDRRGRLGWTLAACLGVALAVGLPARGGAEDAALDPGPSRQEVSLGEVRLTLEADRGAMPIDGRLHLTLIVDAPAHTILTWPEIADQLGPFVVASQTALGPLSDTEGREQWRRDYALEAESVGALIVPSLTIGFQTEIGSAAGAEQLRTEPVAIAVTSVLPPDVDITAPRDIAPPVPLPRATPAWLLWLIGGLALGLGLLALLAWRRWRRPGATALQRQPAHLLALAELDRLQGELHDGRFGTEELYVRLADILRRYVVGRFGLRAPTQTTEELLASAERSGGPIAAGRHLIGRVLAECDLVKFARERPGPGIVQTSLGQARDFVEQTADEQVLVERGAAGASS